jgi:hypothetical protein
MFQWPRSLFAHQGNGLVLPYRLMVEGQVYHIRQIGPSLMVVPLNKL